MGASLGVRVGHIHKQVVETLGSDSPDSKRLMTDLGGGSHSTLDFGPPTCQVGI
jgi:hypothetical protein